VKKGKSSHSVSVCPFSVDDDDDESEKKAKKERESVGGAQIIATANAATQ
jgi:hypothetical protein